MNRTDSDKRGRPGVQRLIRDLGQLATECERRAMHRPELLDVARDARIAVTQLQNADQQKIAKLAELKHATWTLSEGYYRTKELHHKLKAKVFAVYGSDAEQLTAFGMTGVQATATKRRAPSRAGKAGGP
jgi:hypothetical protein